MKKRSLFAAVAMLIVSAIVLTSATYAWFATGGSATQVGKITGNVAEASAGIRLRTPSASSNGGSGWQDALDYKLLATDTANSFATNWSSTGDDTGTILNPTDSGATAYGVYEPISSADPRANTNASPTIFAYSLANNVFGPIDASKSIGDFYDEYSFYVGTLSEAETGTDVDMKIKIGGDAKMAARVAVYSYGDNDGSGTNTWTFHGIYSGATESGWNAITADLAAVNKDNNQNFIVDSSDTGVTGCYTATTAYDAGGSNGQTITLVNCHQTDGYQAPSDTTPNPNPSLSNRLVKCYVWLEGNDSDCAPTHASVPGGDIQVTYTFTMHQA